MSSFHSNTLWLAVSVIRSLTPDMIPMAWTSAPSRGCFSSWCADGTGSLDYSTTSIHPTNHYDVSLRSSFNTFDTSTSLTSTLAKNDTSTSQLACGGNYYNVDHKDLPYLDGVKSSLEKFGADLKVQGDNLGELSCRVDTQLASFRAAFAKDTTETMQHCMESTKDTVTNLLQKYDRMIQDRFAEIDRRIEVSINELKTRCEQIASDLCALLGNENAHQVSTSDANDRYFKNIIDSMSSEDFSASFSRALSLAEGVNITSVPGNESVNVTSVPGTNQYGGVSHEHLMQAGSVERDRKSVV